MKLFALYAAVHKQQPFSAMESWEQTLRDSGGDGDAALK